MPKRSGKYREKLSYIAHHPVQWMRGDGLPDEAIRPWEQAVHIVPQLFEGMRNGFTYQTMYMYQTVFGVNKKQQATAQVATTIWDGINDPLIGSIMDSRNIPVRIHRWISRFSLVITGLTAMFLMLNFGLSPWQRIAVYIAVRCVSDIFGTANSVSHAKIWAHATPHSQEREKLSWAYGVGLAIHEMLVPIATALVGLRDVFGWEESSIYVVGAAIFTVPAILASMGPSLVLQRVPDKVQPVNENRGIRAFFLELKESFVIIRHNKYFMLNLGARLLTMLTPSIEDLDYYRYCGVNEVLNTGVLKSEFVVFFRDNIVSLPCNVLVPFSRPIIKKVGGSRNMVVLQQAIVTVCNLMKYIVGMNTPFGVLFSLVMEMCNRTLGRVQGVAENNIKYEMLDYVEYKTGRRSEGVSMAIDGLMNKLVINNIDKVVGSLVIDGLGFNPLAEKQPPLFLKWAPVLYLLVPAIDSFITLVFRFFYKYPAQTRDMVEAELIQRRQLAQSLEEDKN